MQVWGIHANRDVDAKDMFRQHGVIGIGWPAIGDLSRIERNQASFRKALQRAYPDINPNSVGIRAGILKRFTYQMERDDYVIYPSKHDRMINIGVIKGDYDHRSDFDDDAVNIRKVEWKRTVPRSHFTHGALAEIASALTLFLVKNHTQEFLKALESREEAEGAPAQTGEEALTLQNEVNRVTETTRDFIAKTLSTHFKGHPLADFVGHLLSCMGYRARVSPPGPDQGIDILAHPDALGFQTPIIKVQVKSSEATVGRETVSSLNGTVEQTQFGLFVTLGSYAADAKRFAQNRPNLRLIDGTELIDLILEHYERFDTSYKTALPLKRVYVPSQGTDDDQA